MKFCFYTNSVSPHQLPLARELINRLGAENYRYVYTTPMTDGRRKCGWAEVEEHPAVGGIVASLKIVVCAFLRRHFFWRPVRRWNIRRLYSYATEWRG